MAAFVFAVVRFRGRELLFVLLLATMLIPPQVTLVPNFILFRTLGILKYSPQMALWLPAFWGGAFGTFLLRQFFLTIPRDFAEAARVDGASLWAHLLARLSAAGETGVGRAGDLHVPVVVERSAASVDLPARRSRSNDADGGIVVVPDAVRGQMDGDDGGRARQHRAGDCGILPGAEAVHRRRGNVGSEEVAIANTHQVFVIAHALDTRGLVRRIVISLEQPPGGTWDHQILRGLQPVLQEREFALIMHDASYNGTRDRPEVPFDEQDMDALIVDGHAATDEYLRQMRSAGVPIVLLGRTLPDSDIPTVMPDNFGGARMAVSHLIDHKHQAHRVRHRRSEHRRWPFARAGLSRRHEGSRDWRSTRR